MNKDRCAGCGVCRKCQENEALVRAYEWLAHEVGADNDDDNDDITDFLLSMHPEDALKAAAQFRKAMQELLCGEVLAEQ